MSEQSFICIYCHFPSLTLPPELCLLSDQWPHWILIGAQALLWTVHARDLCCMVLIRIIPKLSPPHHPWKNVRSAQNLGDCWSTPLIKSKNVSKESERKVKVTQSCLTLCNPMNYTVHGILQARILEWVAFPFLLQGIFPTQWPNPGLPHCRWILYQLRHQGRPQSIEKNEWDNEKCLAKYWV